MDPGPVNLGGFGGASVHLGHPLEGRVLDTRNEEKAVAFSDGYIYPFPKKITRRQPIQRSNRIHPVTDISYLRRIYDAPQRIYTLRLGRNCATRGSTHA